MEFSKTMPHSYLDLQRSLVKLLATTGGIWKWLAAATAAVLDYILPETAQSIALAVFAFLILDTMTGFCAAWVRHEPISSRAFGRVLTKLLGYGAVVIVASLVTKNVPGVSDYRSASVTGVLTLILITEAISILENVANMGVKLPAGLVKRLKSHLKDPDDKKDTDR